MPPASQPLTVDVVIAARDASATIGDVVREIPSRVARSVVVVDYGSRDDTAQVAQDAGAVVLREARGGYGAACRRATQHLGELPRPPRVVAFMAADGTDDPGGLPALLAPLQSNEAELVIGVRAGAAGPADRVALRVIGALYRHRFEDFGPFRAIRLPALVALGLSDSSTGYHAEMQIKALRLGLRIAEVPVHPRRGSPARRSRVARVCGDLETTGKALFHALRHSTAR